MSDNPPPHIHPLSYAGERRCIDGVALLALICGVISCGGLVVLVHFKYWDYQPISRLLGIVAVSGGAVAFVGRRWDVTPGRRLYGSWLGLVGVLLGIAPVYVLTFSPPSRQRINYSVARCSSNLRQIGQAAQLYANENGGRFPDHLAAMFETQDIDAQAFVCRATNDTPAPHLATTQATAAGIEAGGHCSYVYLGKDWMADEATATVILGYEPLGHHAGGTNVLYGDGHVEFLPAAKVRAILAELSAGYNPPRPGHLK